MAAELTISLVIEKLQYLLTCKQIIEPRFGTRVSHFINKLNELQKFVDGPKDDQESPLINDGWKIPLINDGWKIDLLQTVYFAEDTIDSFLVKTSLQQQKAIMKAFSCIQFKSQSSRSRFSNTMRKVEYDLEMLFNELILPTASMSYLKEMSVQSSENELIIDGTAEGNNSVPPQELSSNLESLKDKQVLRLDNKSFDEDDSDSIFFAKWRKLKDKEKELIEDAADDVIETIEPGPEVRAASDYLDEETDIIGLEDERHKLCDLIANVYDLCFLIAVVGEGGSGKTTLVRTVYHSRVRSNFDCCVWVPVSQFFRERDVLLRIWEQVADVKDEDELFEETLVPNLHQILLRKRYLIVLDDVHQSVVWEKLRLALPNSLNGSRVILTVRDYKVVQDFRHSLVELRPLSDNESWELFLRTVRKYISNSELMKLRKTILQKCQGLPYTIRMLGGLLSTKEFSLDVWSRVIEQTNQSAFSDLSSPLRACLLYLCLFPKSSDISVRRLSLLWLAEGLVTPSAGNAKAPEDLVGEYLEELDKRKMIDVKKRRSDGRPKTCSVPSTLYDGLFPDAENMGFFHIHGISDSKSKSPKYYIRRLAEHSDIQNNTPPEESVRNIRSYISFNIRMGDKPTDEVGNFLETTIIKGGYGLLTVLDLEGVYKPMLPEKLGKLTLLRYVGLRRTFVELIPESVGDLLHLETLDVKYTNIATLPIFIWKAKKLRHLYLDGIHLKMSIHRSFSGGSLANLQTLSGLLIGNNDPPINWLTGLTGLRKLGLTCHTEPLPKITEWICTGLISLESLKLRAISERAEPSKLEFGSMKNLENLKDLYLVGELPTTFNLRDLPPNLKVLTLSVSKLSEDPMQVLGELRDLHVLRLFANSYTGTEITCHPGGFPKLRVLKLWMLNDLNKCTIKQWSMGALQKLEIRCCKNIQKLEGLQNVNKKNLKKLTLINLKKDFVGEVKSSMGEFVKEKEFKFNPSWD